VSNKNPAFLFKISTTDLSENFGVTIAGLKKDTFHLLGTVTIHCESTGSMSKIYTFENDVYPKSTGEIKTRPVQHRDKKSNSGSTLDSTPHNLQAVINPALRLKFDNLPSDFNNAIVPPSS